MWLIFERKDIWRKRGEMSERSGVEREYSEVEWSEIVQGYCCGVNDRLGGCGGQHPPQYGSGVFLEFHS